MNTTEQLSSEEQDEELCTVAKRMARSTQQLRGQFAGNDRPEGEIRTKLAELEFDL